MVSFHTGGSVVSISDQSDLHNNLCYSQIPGDLRKSLTQITADDGRCSFELFIVAPSTIAHATISDVKAAAQALFDRCLTAAASAKGGVATQIGVYHPTN